MAEKDVEKEKLLKELIKSSKFQEDKLITARGATNQDCQKAAVAIKSLMSKVSHSNGITFC